MLKSSIWFRWKVKVTNTLQLLTCKSMILYKFCSSVEPCFFSCKQCPEKLISSKISTCNERFCDSWEGPILTTILAPLTVSQNFIFTCLRTEKWEFTNQEILGMQTAIRGLWRFCVLSENTGKILNLLYMFI